MEAPAKASAKAPAASPNKVKIGATLVATHAAAMQQNKKMIKKSGITDYWWGKQTGTNVVLRCRERYSRNPLVSFFRKKNIQICQISHSGYEDGDGKELGVEEPKQLLQGLAERFAKQEMPREKLHDCRDAALFEADWKNMVKTKPAAAGALVLKR